MNRRVLIASFIVSVCAVCVYHFLFRKNAESPREQRQRDEKPLACSSEFAYLFSKDNEVRVQIVFGYKDARPARFVGDRYERNFVLQALQELGFERDPVDDDKLEWQESADRSSRRIRLSVVHSSVGPDDDANRKNPHQSWRSDYARKKFKEGFKTADVQLYVGHSRAGGGPDFAPPKCLKNGGIDFAWYKKHRPGHKDMIEALKTSKQDPKVLGLLSCASTQHFSDSLVRVAPKTKIMSSKILLYYVDSLQNLIQILEKIVSPPCAKQP